MPLSVALNTYRNAVIEANSFINLAFQQDASGQYILPQNQRDFITDSAFLKIFIAWESFLESAFIKYMLGTPSILGRNVTRHVQPLDPDHAHKMLIGTQKYVDWANPDIVRKLCNIYFAPGNAIDTFISSVYSELVDLKTIRNAAAHLSSTTSRQLNSLAARLLKTIVTNVNASLLLFSVDPSSATGDTILMTYLFKMDVAAEGIAKG